MYDLRFDARLRWLSVCRVSEDEPGVSRVKLHETQAKPGGYFRQHHLTITTTTTTTT